MAVVETRELTKIFKEGQLGAVNQVNLQTREGEFLVFLGPSGSGKTTLLRMIAGLEYPTAGEILIGGKVVNDLTPRERRIGTTTIYVTHDQVEAMAMGDRIVVLHQGYVRQIGSPTEVYDRPADTFVATFLGSPPMNLLEDGDLIVGFRPEHLLPIELAPN